MEVAKSGGRFKKMTKAKFEIGETEEHTIIVNARRASKIHQDRGGWRKSR